MPATPPERPQYIERITLFVTFFFIFLNLGISFRVARGPATDDEATMSLLFSGAVFFLTNLSHLLVKFPRRTAAGYPTMLDCAIILSAGLMAICVGSQFTLQRERAEYVLSETGDFSQGVEDEDVESIIVIPAGLDDPAEGAGALFFV
ncbi:hypothetical protein TARUN_3516 [Trichoderma arundinaceum]|uniref:Uncharacterized protein n=1 Tax=Trichoderma arundinaceum TaxID=490622 RepID=A0A395NRU4_TRIAR|nr:hypothetical protein TARUN_3516 [Trichoderma arundinaceum]